ncbi:hypothetical protein AB0I60_34585 [Actinosynnema sp. NPDC050436]|uniref:hypothetical protein n=1 Tax=Actinosynnema sp. NPDC050436 TaxID=3155659 RepID=UPI0033D7A44D
MASIQITHRAGTTALAGTTGPIPQGTVVEISVLADIDDQVLVEPLGISTALSGGSAQLRFTAGTPGTFSIRLRDKGLELTSLTVG